MRYESTFFSRTMDVPQCNLVAGPELMELCCSSTLLFCDDGASPSAWYSPATADTVDTGPDIAAMVTSIAPNPASVSLP